MADISARLERHLTADSVPVAALKPGQVVYFSETYDMSAEPIKEVVRVNQNTWSIRTASKDLLPSQVCVDEKKGMIVHGEFLCKKGRELITRGTILKKKGLGLISDSPHYGGEGKDVGPKIHLEGGD